MSEMVGVVQLVDGELKVNDIPRVWAADQTAHVVSVTVRVSDGFEVALTLDEQAFHESAVRSAALDRLAEQVAERK